MEYRPVAGVPCRLWQARRWWWWRCEHWHERTPDIGPYWTRADAVADAEAQLARRPALKGRFS